MGTYGGRLWALKPERTVFPCAFASTPSRPPPPRRLLSATTMAGEDKLAYLKSLVSQLNEKITALEAKAKAAAPRKTPAQQLRTILMGPPGAGKHLDVVCTVRNAENRVSGG